MDQPSIPDSVKLQLQMMRETIRVAREMAKKVRRGRCCYCSSPRRMLRLPHMRIAFAAAAASQDAPQYEPFSYSYSATDMDELDEIYSFRERQLPAEYARQFAQAYGDAETWAKHREVDRDTVALDCLEGLGADALERAAVAAACLVHLAHGTTTAKASRW